jgi:hypothetical protein
MGRKDALPRDEMVDYVMSCWDDEAGTYFTIICSTLRFDDDFPVGAR